MPALSARLTAAASLFVAAVLAAPCSAGEVDFAPISKEFDSHILPALKSLCLGCHSTEKKEGELDLEQFASLADVRHVPQVWLKVAEMLDNGEMPPEKSPQFGPGQKQQFREWIDRYLDAEALAGAGDPGPVILRRLTNAEYNYSVRDLTGIPSLDPTKEFPVDGAAGEGFTNAGSAQGMSPSLVQKYLDAGKEVASHVVLYPDGIDFSEYTTERDRTDELVRRIQAFYRRYTVAGGGQHVNLQGIQFDTNQGGLLPLEKYLTATLQERQALQSGAKSLQQVASERKLSVKYLTTLWTVLTGAPTKSPMLNSVQKQWAAAQPDSAPQLAGLVHTLSVQLWKYNAVGHIGKSGETVPWMEPVTPVATNQAFDVPLNPDNAALVRLTLIATDAGDGNEQDQVLWENPRLVGPTGPEIPLRNLPGLLKKMESLQKGSLEKTAVTLDAVTEFMAGTDHSLKAQEAIAARHQLDPTLLKLWINYLDIGEPRPVVITGHMESKLANPEHTFIRGWGVDATPIVLANSSDSQVRIPGISRPHSIVAHPSPTLFVAAGWQSPISGTVQVNASLSDAHPECGNGQEYVVQHRTGEHVGNLWQGSFGTGGSAEMPVKLVSVRKGDVIALVIGPREGNHSCDLTDIHLTVTEQGGENRIWSVTEDCSPDLQSANPHPDRLGNPAVWHFYQGPMSDVNLSAGEFVAVPAGSILANWMESKDPAARKELALKVQQLVAGEAPADKNSPEALLYEQVRNLALAPHSIEDLLQGIAPNPEFAANGDLIATAQHLIEYLIPGKLAEGRRLVTRVRLDTRSGQEGSIRAHVMSRPVTATDPEDRLTPGLQMVHDLPLSTPILVNEGSTRRQEVEAGFAEFRNLFPPTLCYERIVPVDEVVTLTLYYRQDDLLQQLMLSDAETDELNRLWDELLYVAQEPLKYQVAFEQIREFATQDRPDLVKVWNPLVEIVEQRTDAFRKRLVETEPAHVQGVLEFANQAWRHPLSDAERQSLRDLYRALRTAKLPHEEAIHLLIARVLASPEFLYRREQPATGKDADFISRDELATRLSYFLWSTLPDAELRRSAEFGQLADKHNTAELLQQTHRMLDDARTRRLAEQFACQWLHLRNFDQTEEKNETLFPEFVHLRGAMYEETVLFFEDMFRKNGSILDLLNADHTFVNEALAKHYGWSDVTGPEWRRIEGVQSRGRGGVLAMATVLASQSGASRTSPILRGNWVYETLLGEKLPRPPAGVPIIPDEAPRGLTARQLIEQHSSVASCARCHLKIDPFGFALEQYEADGSLRPAAADTRTTLVEGKAIEGLDGLRKYLAEDRRETVVRQFCRKLLGYALGREIQLSDHPLLDQMQSDLAAHDYQFQVAIDAIVTSDQFRKVRGQTVAE